MSDKERRFNFAGFALFIAAQVFLLLWGISFFLPNVWKMQLAAGPIRILSTFLYIELFACFIELLFHRDVLHTVTIPWLRAFSQKHGTHHQLTIILLLDPPDAALSGDERLVHSRYPIVLNVQWESAMFPAYAFAAFCAVFTPIFGMLWWLFPHTPFIFSGILALACSLLFYEESHALDHMPYEWWKGKIEHPRFGRFWRREYGFHMLHHYDVRCNQNVFGFFFIALADRVLGTYCTAEPLLIDKTTIKLQNISPYRPCRLIQWLDRMAFARERKLMLRAHNH